MFSTNAFLWVLKRERERALLILSVVVKKIITILPQIITNLPQIVTILPQESLTWYKVHVQ